MTPVSCTGIAGRAAFSNFLPPPHPATKTAPATHNNGPRVHPLFILPLIPGRTLSEPDGLPLGDQVVHLLLNPLPYSLRKSLHELEVLCVAGSIAVERDRRQKADLELRGEVHHPGREPRPRERVVDREVD